MNNTQNNTESLTQWEQVFLTSGYAVSMAMSLLGNVLVLDIIRKNKPMRSRTNLLIANQACADLLVTLVFMPGQVKVVFVGLAWFGGIFGLVTCKLFYGAQYLCCAASVFSLLAITADRYFAVAHPLRRSPLARHFKKILLAIWLVSVSFQVLTLIISELDYNQNQIRCMYNIWKVNVMELVLASSFSLLFSFMIPSVAIVTLFIKIVRRLWTRSIPGHIPSDLQRIQLKRTNIKVTKMMVAVSSLLWLSWLPFMILIAARIELPYPTYLFCVWLTSNYSAINPWIYLLYSTPFRQKLMQYCECLRVRDLENAVNIAADKPRQHETLRYPTQGFLTSEDTRL